MGGPGRVGDMFAWAAAPSRPMSMSWLQALVQRQGCHGILQAAFSVCPPPATSGSSVCMTRFLTMRAHSRLRSTR